MEVGTGSDVAGQGARRGEAVLGVFALLVVVLVVAAYLPALRAAYVWDDEVLVANDTRCNAHILRCFAIPFFPSSPFLDVARVYYRPLVTASFVAFDSAAEHHAVNVALHAVNALLLLLLARRAGASPLRAGALTLAWALHPRLAEAVTWVVGRTDLLAATFTFGALLAWPAPALPDARRDLLRRLAASALLAFGMLSKEVAFAGAVAAIAVSLRVEGLRRGAWRSLPVLASVAAVGVARFAALGLEGNTAGPTTPLPAVLRLVAPFEALARYVQMTLLFTRPWSARGAWGVPSLPHVVVGIVLAAALVRVAVRLLQRGAPREVLVLVAGLAAALACLQVVPVALHGAFVADRLLYVPLGAFVVVLASAPVLGARAERGLAALAVVVALVAVPFTRRAAAAFGDEIAFLVTVAERADPANAGPRNAVAAAARDRGAPVLACELFARSREILGDDVRRGGTAFLRTSENLAGCFLRVGRIEEAIALFEEIARDLARSPGGGRERAGRVAIGLGYARLAALDFAGASAAADRAGAFDARLGVQVGKLRRAAESARADWAIVRRAPADAHVLRARFAASVGRTVEAQREWEIAAGDVRLPIENRVNAIRYLAIDGSLDGAERAAAACPECGSLGEADRFVAECRARVAPVVALRDRIAALAR